jgi:hypothetical protein
VKISRAHIDERKDRPPEYFDDFLSLGTWDGEEFVIPDEAFAKFRERWAPKGPTLVEMAANFTKATARWVLAGCPIVSEEVMKRRMGPDGCGLGLPEGERCKNFDPVTLGGRCRLCGCGAQWKAAWATEKCPDGRAGWATVV